ncbi:MAG: DUF3683 domain-containing protein [Magnetococcales bacterium]|nr:DUF3683 domain-containing protein [Magnetococcales bacterium]
MTTPEAPRIREIPYNYTSFSDREVILRFLGTEAWEIFDKLREQRRTGRSARMMLDVLGDLWVANRNPFIQDDLLDNPKRLEGLLEAMGVRLDQIEARANGNQPVLRLLTLARRAVGDFNDAFTRYRTLRRRVLDRLSPLTRRDNIDFSGAARTAHVTDASDWRVELPFVVLTPEREEEVLPLVQGCIDLGLIIIPRGGGTGYTGSAIPLHAETAVINCEKLDRVGTVALQALPGRADPVPTLVAGAGAVTQRLSETAELAGYVFAVDPTSQSASTIGGNIAMNAGGKKAVLWGTTLDNLLSWRMVTPDAQWLEVTRLDHNLGKIHDAPTARFRLERFHADGRSPAAPPEELEIPAAEFRKPGLGKDVTNKTLGGLPGVQKEGCDGIVTSAVFVLHRMPRHQRTICLEFYGPDLGTAVPAIVEIKEYLDHHPTVRCAGLEHLDERYVRAVGYTAKASRQELPKMVLLADLAGEDEDQTAETAAHVVELAAARNGEGFIAVTPEGRKRFWADRSRTAAIAAHTNAFKVNEDVVIPLPRLADYSEGVERINIEQSIRNKLRIVEGVREFLHGETFATQRLGEDVDSSEEAVIVADKRKAACAVLERASSRWRGILDHLDEAAADHVDWLDDPAAPPEPGTTLIRLLLRRGLRVSYRGEVAQPLRHIFSGDQWVEVHRRLDAIHAAIRSSRLFVALHMHAGDGNVHTNIPVNSNDYDMLREADRMVDRIMALALQLGGAISGEHGIGLTKLRYLEPERLAAFAAYKKRVDPHDRFNRGKLIPGGATLDNAYTPSLRLVQQEALILRESALGDLNDDVRHCLRCGKCKAVCSTHVPRANLLYSPRNKILSAGLLIEAFLYEEQSRRGISLHHFDALWDVADHCTVCHRCVKPCPVNIDFGDVTIRMREILKSRGKRKGNPGSRLALGFLNLTDPQAVHLARLGMIRWGYAGQRMAHGAARKLGMIHDEKRPAATTGRPSVEAQILHLIRTPLPDFVPPRTAREMLGIEDNRHVPLLGRPGGEEEHGETVFYFPGCGCERLYSDVALATLALLNHGGVRVALPPGYLCCGFPQAAAGDRETSRRMTTGNRVLFHRVANTLNYLDIKTVLVSCGTCMNQLTQYEFDKIFPGSRLLDIHEYLLEKGIRAPVVAGENRESFLFHDPCHSPIRQKDPVKVVEGLLGGTARLSDRCCGEAGTFAVARPDIAAQVRYRKEEELLRGQGRLAAQKPSVDPPRSVLTACPACLQGLSRYGETTGLNSQFLVVELAKRLLGADWRLRLLDQWRNGGMERILY